MIINTNTSNPEVGKPITLKLVTGEEVLGKVTDVTAEYLSILKPLVVFINPNNGQLVMQNVVLSCDHDKPVQFNRAVIVAYAAPEKGIADQYMQSLTGIITPPKGLVA